MSYINIYLTRPSNHLDLVPGSLSLSPPLLSRPLPFPPLCSAPFKRAQSYSGQSWPYLSSTDMPSVRSCWTWTCYLSLSPFPLTPPPPPFPCSAPFKKAQSYSGQNWLPIEFHRHALNEIFPQLRTCYLPLSIPSPAPHPCSALFTRAQSHTRQDWPSMSSMDMPSMRSSHHLDLLPGTRPVQSVGSNLVRRDARYISDTAMISDSHCSDRVVQRLCEIMKINAFILQNNWFTVWWKFVCACACVCWGGGGCVCLSACVRVHACVRVCVPASVWVHACKVALMVFSAWDRWMFDSNLFVCCFCLIHFDCFTTCVFQKQNKWDHKHDMNCVY